MIRSGRKIVVLALLAVSACSLAQNVGLTNNGSVININAGTGGGLFGVNSWTIGNGPNNVNQELYLIRIGGNLQSFNQISAPGIDQTRPDLATITYTSGANLYDVSTSYLLRGGAPNSADLAEVTTLINRGNGPLTFTLFEYDNFKPGGINGGTGTLLNSSTIRQVNAAGSITVGATNIPDHWMIDTVANVQGAIVGGGDLTDAHSPFTNNDTLAFAFQWNVTVGQGLTWQMSKDKLLNLNPVPEPASLLTLGGLAVLAIRRRRKSS